MAFSPGLDKSLGASCKDSIGWMFSKLDTSADLFLDQTELAAVNLDKYEVCIRPFFNSCDTYKDGHVSTAEWCFCFWRESECGPSQGPRPPALLCRLCPLLQAVFGSRGGSLLATSPCPELFLLPHFLHSLSTSSLGAQGSQHLNSLPRQAPRWILWVLKLMHFRRPALRKSIKNYTCKISRAPQRAWKGLRVPEAEAGLASQ